MTEELKLLERLLANHDWFYDWSDDMRVYERGRDQKREITALANKLRQDGYAEQVADLYETYQRK